MSATYSRHSPYYGAKYFGNFMDVVNIPVIPAKYDDVLFTINLIYQNRPDLLAYDLYGDANLWWVFAARNPDRIEDPVKDMTPGLQIFIPNKNTITAVLG